MLPENADRELKPGETYEPLVPASSRTPEVTTRSIVLGMRASTINWMGRAGTDEDTGHQISI